MKKQLFCIGILGLFSGIPNLMYAQQYVEKKITQNNGNVSLVTFKANSSITSSSAKEIFKDVLKLTPGFELKLARSSQDFTGKFNEEKYQLYYKGIKVEGGNYNLHYKQGKLSSMNGEVFQKVSHYTTPQISAAAAFDAAIKNIGAEKYMWQDLEYTANNDYKKPQGELVYIPLLQSDGSYIIYLTYKFDIYAAQPLTRDNVYVDAITGRVLAIDPIMKHARKTSFNAPSVPNFSGIQKEAKAIVFPTLLNTGNAETRYSGTKEIETTFVTENENYILHDTTRGNGVHTFNLKKGSALGSAVEFTDDDNNWTAEEHDNSTYDNVALDAHWGVEKTYDYFKTKFSRDSYNGNGGILKSYVHYLSGEDNAYWSGSEMLYGDGATYFTPLTAFDVTAHELGHGVCGSTAQLLYQRESGALNEGLSDIWGAAAEFTYAPEKDTYLIGEDITKVSPYYLRSMSNPNVGFSNQPDTYRGTYWSAATVEEGCASPSWLNDYCGVHTNSGVINHWFYVLSEGKSGTNDLGDEFAVDGIGIDEAAKIAYRLETEYLTSNSDYQNARDYGVQSAIDLFGENSEEHKATQNAFYAVGLGPKYVWPPDVTAPSAPSNLSAANTTGSSTTLSWTAATDENGIGSYSIYKDGNLTGTVNKNTLSYVVTGLATNTTYEFYVKASDAYDNISTESNVVEVTTTDTPDYCTSSSNNAGDERIGRVQFVDIDNPSTGTSGYEDFTYLSTDVQLGSTNEITITPFWTALQYSEGYAVFIDLNHNGLFTDAGELVFSKSPSNTTPIVGEITIPETATLGSTRMRVILKFNQTPSNPCGTFTYGQVEDYTINIVDESLGTAGIAANGATVLYPNPVKDVINIKTKVSGEFSYKVYNTAGQLVLVGKSADKKVNTTKLASGNYIIELADNASNTITQKFIKK